jgi:DNA-directed RNA polymerase subunit RPC12/RpoP
MSFKKVVLSLAVGAGIFYLCAFALKSFALNLGEFGGVPVASEVSMLAALIMAAAVYAAGKERRSEEREEAAGTGKLYVCRYCRKPFSKPIVLQDFMDGREYWSCPHCYEKLQEKSVREVEKDEGEA